ncbi:hypothetical protein SBOR_8816 [Sclerotinia borealis F-4128]|uniref:RRM domain-containing protein n=1 Tax=Sclerotinia borealis (strain F-4128) TaxID=1432307 RepID=W9C4M9_SCLBF|nr:hypothetical protein SBOR_8816 [Sclerotinia borealis F-4128]
MPQVLSSDVTGLYYILVSNLPWSCTWQRLKDFAQNQDYKGNCLAVEHVQVYPESTCGWVTVRGKEDFLQALQHLQGGMMENRALCADGRNETESIEVRDLAMPWTSRYYSEGVFTRDIQPTTREASITTSISATFNNDRGVTKTQNIEIPYNTPIPSEFSAVIASDVSVFASPPQTYITTSPFFGALSQPMSSSAYNPPFAEQFVVLKSKVIITRIPNNTTTTDLQSFIQDCIKARSLDNSSDENPLLALQSMRIEKHPCGKQKSHAFLIFKTYTMAKAIVDMLDGVNFRGRDLRAKLAKEGVDPREMSSMQSQSNVGLTARESPPKTHLPLKGEKMRKPKERAEGRDRIVEDIGSERVEASAVAAVAANAKREASLNSPMVINGSSPGLIF